MRAILLAAGRGRRLKSDGPKVLLDIDGKTLLQRHVELLAVAGIDALTVVVGFQRDVLEAAIRALDTKLPIEIVVNPDWERGSIVSLHVAIDGLVGAGGLWMDADVLYPVDLMQRLVRSPHRCCVLLDGSSQESGEEMMVGTRAGRAVKIARRVGSDWDFAGENVGFFKVDAPGAQAMKRLLAEEVAAGRLDQEYEAAVDRAFAEVAFGFERVDDMPWTEIDFPEDVEKAEHLARTMR